MFPDLKKSGCGGVAIIGWEMRVVTTIVIIAVVSLMLLLSTKLASLDVAAMVVLVVSSSLAFGGNNEVCCCWWVGSKILVRSRQVDVMTLALFWERVVFCIQLPRSWFLSFILLS